MKATKRKGTSKLDYAAARLAEIVIEHMSTLPIEKAKAMREEIRRLAGRKNGRRAAAGRKIIARRPATQ
jgi:hypothetical protein